MAAYLLQRLVRRAPRSEPIRTIQEIRLKDWLQDQQGRHLYHPVAHRRDSQRPQFPICLLNVNAFHRLRLVGLRPQRVLNPFQTPCCAFVCPPYLWDRDPIHSGRSFIAAHPFPRRFQHIQPIDPVVQRVEPELRFLLGLLAPLLSQLRNFLWQSRLFHRSRHRLSCGCPSLRSRIFIQAVFSSSYRFMLSVRPLGSIRVTGLLRYYGPPRLPTGSRVGYVFPPPVGRLRFHPAGPPTLLD